MEFVEAYIERIAHVNPLINAVARTNYDEARQTARLFDRLVSSALLRPGEQAKASNRVMFLANSL